MAFILHLPVELLDYIVELSGLEESISLTFVCRIFNAIATPHAYRHVSLHDRHKKDPCIQLFLRTILDRPSVGEHVRELGIEFTDPLKESRLRCVPDSELGAPVDLRRFAADAASYGLPPGTETALLNGSIGAMLFLLLCHLPALRSLEMNPLMPCNELFFRLVSYSSTLPCGLQSLRSVSLSHWDTSPFNWNRISQFLSLPNLSAIRCMDAVIEAVDLVSDHGASDEDEDSSDDEQENHSAYSLNNLLVKGCSGVEVIQLEGCMVEDEPLVSLVTSSRCLRSFEYRHDITIPDVIFTARPLGHALRQCAQATLENLALDFNFDGMQFAEPPGSLGSLRDFVQLKHVSTAISVLLDEPWHEQAHHLGRLLPPSLISLSLWIDPDWEAAGWDSIVVQLLESKCEHVPLFKTLHLGGHIDSTEEAAVRAACVSMQVELILLSSRRLVQSFPPSLNSNAILAALPAGSTSDIISIPHLDLSSIIPPPNVFGSTFFQSIAGNTLDEPDPSILRYSDIDFERDFGQWFNNDFGKPCTAEDPGPTDQSGQSSSSASDSFSTESRQLDADITRKPSSSSDQLWVPSSSSFTNQTSQLASTSDLSTPFIPSLEQSKSSHSSTANNPNIANHPGPSIHSASIQPSSQFTQDAESYLMVIPNDVTSTNQPEYPPRNVAEFMEAVAWGFPRF